MKVEYGQKNLYFRDEETRELFIELYKDVFVRTVAAKGYVYEGRTSLGPYNHGLRFWMNHELWRQVQKDLRIKKKAIIVKHDYRPGYATRHILVFE